MIGDSFRKSLKRLIWHQHPVYKVWEFFRYKLPSFFKNIWRFKKELYEHRWYDYSYTLRMLKRSLEIMRDGLEKEGYEVRESLEPKINTISLVISLLQNKIEDNYIERAEKSLGPLILNDWEFEEDPNADGFYKIKDEDDNETKNHNRKVFELAKQMEDTEWELIWKFIHGTEFSKKVGEEYDGSDMRSWWD